MTTASQNFVMYAGDTKNLVITVTDISGAIINLTGAIVKWKLTYSNGTIYKDTTGGGVTITSPTTGVFTVKLNSIDTSSLSGNFLHGAELIDSSGNVSTILAGIASINTAII